MKSKVLLTATLIAATALAHAQDNKAYAFTGKATSKFLWADIKQVDLATGNIVKTIFEADKTTYKITTQNRNEVADAQELLPTNFGIAASAFDARSNKLFFASMHFSDLRYLDLSKSTPEFTIIKRNIIPVTATSRPYQVEENQFTRMAIGADGYGYAMTNDGNHLIRFTTGRKPSVEDLGAVMDAASNSGISIHNKCTSWGGDMIADAFGKLVIISANHNVFVLDVKTKVATHIGAVTGLPVNFTTNGAVVDANGDIVVSSANVFEGLYKFNFKELKATGIATSDKTFNASDLANSNLLFQKQANDNVKFDLGNMTLPAYEVMGDARVFPNPVTADQFNVSFEGLTAGKYNIVFADLTGRTLQQKSVSIKGNQVETIKLINKMAKGMYWVKVLDENGRIAFTQKIVLQ